MTQYQCTAALVRTKCIPHCLLFLCITGWHHCCVTTNRPLGICSSYRCAVSQYQCTAALVKTKCIPHCLLFLCKTGWQHCCVTTNRPLGICSSYRCAVSQYQCRPVLQCIGDWTLHICVFEKYSKVSLQWHYNAVNLFCRATQGSEECILSWPVLQCIGNGTLHTCVFEKYPKVSLQWHYNAVSLFCRETKGSEECILFLWQSPDQCCSALVMGHCTPVCLQNIQRCLCSDTTMLSACFAEKQKAVRNAFCFSDKVLTSVVVHWWWHTVHLCVCKISKGVFPLTLQCCQPVLHSNTGQWGMLFVLTSAAVHWYWVTAHLYDEQKS